LTALRFKPPSQLETSRSFEAKRVAAPPSRGLLIGVYAGSPSRTIHLHRQLACSLSAAIQAAQATALVKQSPCLTSMPRPTANRPPGSLSPPKSPQNRLQVSCVPERLQFCGIVSYEH
jgi:hypothetical protein